MSTLEYLDTDGNVKFGFVPYEKLNHFLSILNGNPHHSDELPTDINRGKVIAELEQRRTKKSKALEGLYHTVGLDRGYGKDWRSYKNEQGYTHLEELIIYQPKEWRKQAREYVHRFICDITRENVNQSARVVKIEVITGDGDKSFCDIVMMNPIRVTLFHDEIPRTARYEPLNFLLSYGAQDLFPKILKELELNQDVEAAFFLQLSP